MEPDFDLEFEYEEEFIPETVFDSFKKDLELKSLNADEIKKKLNLICTSVLSKPSKKLRTRAGMQRKKLQLNRDRSVMDCSTLSEKYISTLMAEFNEQQQRLEERKKELQTDLNHWNFEMRTELDDQYAELLKKQQQLEELEAENEQLAKKLEKKDIDFETQTKKLRAEREQLKARECELDQKVKEYEAIQKEFNNRLKEIDTESKKLEEQREKLINDQQQFAKQVSEFEGEVKAGGLPGSVKPPEDTEEELSQEWLKLHEEEDRLEGIRSELMFIKDKFIKQLTNERQELVSEREALAEEWDKVKLIRQNLKASMPNIEAKLRELFEQEGKTKIKLLTKGQLTKFEKKIEKLEEKFLNDLSELLANQDVTKSDEIEKEWSNLKAEEEKLDRIRTEMLDVKGQIIEKYTKQRDELNLERKKLEDKWKKLCKIQKQIMDKETQLYTESKSKVLSGKDKDKKKITKDSDAGENAKDTNIKEISKDLKKSTKLDSSLRELQKELRSEWQELHSQHEKLTQIISEFSKAREIFEKGKKTN